MTWVGTSGVDPGFDLGVGSAGAGGVGRVPTSAAGSGGGSGGLALLRGVRGLGPGDRPGREALVRVRPGGRELRLSRGALRPAQGSVPRRGQPNVRISGRRTVLARLDWSLPRVEDLDLGVAEATGLAPAGAVRRGSLRAAKFRRGREGVLGVKLVDERRGRARGAGLGVVRRGVPSRGPGDDATGKALGRGLPQVPDDLELARELLPALEEGGLDVRVNDRVRPLGQGAQDLCELGLGRLVVPEEGLLPGHREVLRQPAESGRSLAVAARAEHHGAVAVVRSSVVPGEARRVSAIPGKSLAKLTGTAWDDLNWPQHSKR